MTEMGKQPRLMCASALPRENGTRVINVQVNQKNVKKHFRRYRLQVEEG